MRFEEVNGMDALWLDDDEWSEFASLEALIRADEAEAEAERLATEVARLRRTNMEAERRAALEDWERYRAQRARAWRASQIGLNPWAYGGDMHRRAAGYYMVAWQAARMQQMGYAPNMVQQGAMKFFGL